MAVVKPVGLAIIAVAVGFCVLQGIVDTAVRMWAITQGVTPYPGYSIAGWLGLAIVTVVVLRTAIRMTET